MIEKRLIIGGSVIVFASVIALPTVAGSRTVITDFADFSTMLRYPAALVTTLVAVTITTIPAIVGLLGVRSGKLQDRYFAIPAGMALMLALLSVLQIVSFLSSGFSLGLGLFGQIIGNSILSIGCAYQAGLISSSDSLGNALAVERSQGIAVASTVQQPSPPPVTLKVSSLARLKGRLAKGEIAIEEYEQIRAALEEE